MSSDLTEGQRELIWRSAKKVEELLESRIKSLESGIDLPVPKDEFERAKAGAVQATQVHEKLGGRMWGAHRELLNGDLESCRRGLGLVREVLDLLGEPS